MSIPQIQNRLSSIQVSLDTTLNSLGIADELDRAQQTICTLDFAGSIVKTFALGIAAGAAGAFVGTRVLRGLSPLILNRPLQTMTQLSFRALARMSAGEWSVRLCTGMFSFGSNGLVFNALSGHMESRGVMRTAADMGLCHFFNLFINPKIATVAAPLMRVALHFLVGGAVFNSVTLSREALERHFGTAENSEHHLLSQILINYAMHSGSMLGGHFQERFTNRFGEGIQYFFSKLAANAEQALKPRFAIAGFEGVEFNENILFSDASKETSVAADQAQTTSYSENYIYRTSKGNSRFYEFKGEEYRGVSILINEIIALCGSPKHPSMRTLLREILHIHDVFYTPQELMCLLREMKSTLERGEIFNYNSLKICLAPFRKTKALQTPAGLKAIETLNRLTTIAPTNWASEITRLRSELLDNPHEIDPRINFYGSVANYIHQVNTFLNSTKETESISSRNLDLIRATVSELEGLALTSTHLNNLQRRFLRFIQQIEMLASQRGGDPVILRSGGRDVNGGRHWKGGV